MAFGRKRRAQQLEEASRRFREIIPDRITTLLCESGEIVQCWDMFTLGAPAGRDFPDDDGTWIVALTNRALIITHLPFFRQRDRADSTVMKVPYDRIAQCDHIQNDDWRTNNFPAHTLVLRDVTSKSPLQFYSLGLPRNGVEELLVRVVRDVQVRSTGEQ